MELFGVQEVSTSKAGSAPGYTYVAEPVGSGGPPASRKRAARTLGAAVAVDYSAKQEAKVLRDLAALDKESHRDVHIPVPIRHRDAAGRVSHGKTTPGVRKILQSQKTFSNHLADFEALSALAGPNTTTASAPVSVAPTPTTRGSPVPAVAQPPPKRSHKKKDPNAAAATPLRKVSTPGAVSTPIGSADQVDTQMGDALALANEQQDFAPHPGDRDPLLKSRIPPMPTAAEIAELLAQPPLTYREARATLEEQDSRPGGVRYPPRHFCEICGYWGKVRCTRCGTRVCALECLRTHGEDCYQRYGA